MVAESYSVEVLNLDIPNDMMDEKMFGRLLPDILPDLVPIAWEFPLMNGKKCDILARFNGLKLVELKILRSPETYEQGLNQLVGYASQLDLLLENLNVDGEYGLMLVMGVAGNMKQYVKKGPFLVGNVRVKPARVKSLKTGLIEDVQNLRRERDSLFKGVRILSRRQEEMEKVVDQLDVKKAERRAKGYIAKAKGELNRLDEQISGLKVECIRLGREVKVGERRLSEQKLEVVKTQNAVYLKDGATSILVGWIKDGAFAPHENYNIFVSPKVLEEDSPRIGG